MEAVLSRQKPLREHTNRGLRALIIAEMGEGGEERYFDGFRRAGLGSLPDDRARVARVADLFPRRFSRDNRGLGSEIIVQVDDDGAREAAPNPGGRSEDREDLFGDLSDEEPASSGAPPAQPVGVDEIFPRAARPVRARAFGPDTAR